MKDVIAALDYAAIEFDTDLGYLNEAHRVVFGAHSVAGSNGQQEMRLITLRVYGKTWKGDELRFMDVRAVQAIAEAVSGFSEGILKAARENYISKHSCEVENAKRAAEKALERLSAMEQGKSTQQIVGPRPGPDEEARGKVL